MNPQTGAWVGTDDAATRMYLIRLYADGSMTAETKDLETGRYSGEVAIAPEAGWFEDATPLTVVS